MPFVVENALGIITRKRTMKLNHATAQAAEDLACQYLKKQGYAIVARNWHCPFGEIDVIAKKKQLLLFVEVKWRKNAAFGGVQESITHHKKIKMHRTIEMYLQQYPHRGDVRADAILIQAANQPEQFENILDGF